MLLNAVRADRLADEPKPLPVRRDYGRLALIQHLQIAD